MILNLGPLKGAMFGSVVALKESLESLSGVGAPDMAAFYRDEGVVLFSANGTVEPVREFRIDVFTKNIHSHCG